MKKKNKVRNIALASSSLAVLAIVPVTAAIANHDDEVADIQINVGEKTTLSAVAEFLEDKAGGDKDYKIEWSITGDDKKIASIDSNGVVTGKAAGKAEVVATIKGESNLRATAIIEVKSTVTGLDVKNREITVRVGEELPVEYQVLPSNAATKEIKMKSSSTKVAKVNASKGTITGVEAGETDVVINTVDAGQDPFNNPIQETVKVKVVSTVTGVEVTNVKNNKLELNSGDKFTTEYNVLPSNAFFKDVTFKSSNTTAVSVNNKGVITANKAGQATITVETKDGSHEATFDVIVDGGTDEDEQVAVEKVSIVNKSELANTLLTDTPLIELAVLPQNYQVKNSSFTYEVQDPSVLKVSSGGKITPISIGTTTIKVVSKDNEDVYDTVKVNVYSDITGLVGEDTWELRVGEIATAPVHTLPVDNETLKMYVDFDKEGIVDLADRRNFKGIAPGEVLATFYSPDGKYQHEMKIKVISTVKSFDIPFERIELGLEPYSFIPQILPEDAFLKDVKYEIENPKIISINAKTHTISPKAEGETKVKATTVDGGLVDEFTVVVDYDATKLKIYDEKNKLISSSDINEKEAVQNNFIRKMILQKVLEKTENPIVKRVLNEMIAKM